MEDEEKIGDDYKLAVIQTIMKFWRSKTVADFPHVRVIRHEDRGTGLVFEIQLHARFKQEFTYSWSYIRSRWESLFEKKEVEKPVSKALEPFAKNLPNFFANPETAHPKVPSFNQPGIKCLSLKK